MMMQESRKPAPRTDRRPAWERGRLKCVVSGMLLLAAVTCRAELVINEIMYHP